MRHRLSVAAIASAVLVALAVVLIAVTDDEHGTPSAPRINNSLTPDQFAGLRRGQLEQHIVSRYGRGTKSANDRRSCWTYTAAPELAPATRVFRLCFKQGRLVTKASLTAPQAIVTQ